MSVKLDVSGHRRLEPASGLRRDAMANGPQVTRRLCLCNESSTTSGMALHVICGCLQWACTLPQEDNCLQDHAESAQDLPTAWAAQDLKDMQAAGQAFEKSSVCRAPSSLHRTCWMLGMLKTWRSARPPCGPPQVQVFWQLQCRR